jgi:3-oxoacyl-[acyl-carrier protein] reductase
MLEPYADFRDKLEKQIPVRRYATPADIGGVVNFLMSADAGYITGADLPVDGGLTASLGIQR